MHADQGYFEPHPRRGAVRVARAALGKGLVVSLDIASQDIGVFDKFSKNLIIKR
ncbi:MAG: hypothetical protein Q8R55_00955 [Candidatus Taylorbacteria bacterium]|nr:hypothetical protein [Candidatus Taylorbacteria bacterium]